MYSHEICSCSVGKYKCIEVAMAESGKYMKDKRLNSFDISNAWAAKGSATNITTGLVEHSDRNELRKNGID